MIDKKGEDIPRENTNLFSTSRGGDIPRETNNLFSTSKGEDIPRETNNLFSTSKGGDIPRKNTNFFSTSKGENIPKENNNLFSTTMKTLHIVLFGIIIGFAVSIFSALFSNTVHWTWIFDYIIFASILVGITISIILFLTKLKVWICFVIGYSLILSFIYIFITNYHFWNSPSTVCVFFVLLAFVLFFFALTLINYLNSAEKYSNGKVAVFLICIILFSSIIAVDYLSPENLVNKTFPDYYNERISINVLEDHNFSYETLNTAYLDVDNRIQVAVKHNKNDYDTFLKEQNNQKEKYGWNIIDKGLPIDTVAWKSVDGWYYVLVVNPKLSNDDKYKGVYAVLIGSDNEEKTIEIAKSIVFIKNENNKTVKWNIFRDTVR